MENEKVLVFPASLINEADYVNGIITGFEINSILDKILKSGQLSYIDRDLAENNPSFKQIIPYCILSKQTDILRYQRTKKGGESRLHDLWSIGIGGHINPVDGESTDYNSVWNAMSRELREEVDTDGIFVKQPIALLYDNSNDVGKVHFGLVMLVNAGNSELKFNDPALSNGKFDSLENIKLEADQFENWSKLIIGSGVLEK